MARIWLKSGVGITSRRKPQEREHWEQVDVIQWVLRTEPQYPPLRLLYAIPNGGHRHAATAGKLKAEGVKAGISDLCWPYPSRTFHGLYLEMKAFNGKLSEAQRDFLTEVSFYGYCAAVAFGAQHAIEILKWYAGMSETRPEGLI